MDKLFIDKKHQKNFMSSINKDGANSDDIERICLFYILSFHDKFRDNIFKFYNFKERSINSNVFEEMMFSDGERALIRLAFHLFTGRDDYKATICNTFYHLGGDFLEIAKNAVLIYIGDKKICVN